MKKSRSALSTNAVTSSQMYFDMIHLTFPPQISPVEVNLTEEEMNLPMLTVVWIAKLAELCPTTFVKWQAGESDWPTTRCLISSVKLIKTDSWTVLWYFWYTPKALHPQQGLGSSFPAPEWSSQEGERQDPLGPGKPWRWAVNTSLWSQAIFRWKS